MSEKRGARKTQTDILREGGLLVDVIATDGKMVKFVRANSDTDNTTLHSVIDLVVNEYLFSGEYTMY